MIWRSGEEETQLSAKQLCGGSIPPCASNNKKLFLGEVPEWLNGPVLKTGIPVSESGVRIPPSPPDWLV